MPWIGSVLSHSTKLAWKVPRRRERFLRGKHAKWERQCITRCMLVWMCALLPMWETLPEHHTAPAHWESRYRDTTQGPRSANATLEINWSVQHSQPPKQSSIEYMTMAAEICTQWIRDAPPAGAPVTVQDPSPARHNAKPLGTSRSVCVLCTLPEQHAAPEQGEGRCKDATHTPLSANTTLGINWPVQHSQPPKQSSIEYMTMAAEICAQWIRDAPPAGAPVTVQDPSPARHNAKPLGTSRSVCVLCTLPEQHAAPEQGEGRCKDATHTPLSANTTLGINWPVQHSQPPEQTLEAWLTADAEICPQWIRVAPPVGTSAPARSFGLARHEVMIIGAEQSVRVMYIPCWHAGWAATYMSFTVRSCSRSDVGECMSHPRECSCQSNSIRALQTLPDAGEPLSAPPRADLRSRAGHSICSLPAPHISPERTEPPVCNACMSISTSRPRAQMRQTTRAERGLPPREHPRSHYRADGRRRRTATELRQRGWQSWEGHNEWRHGATESTGWWHGWNSWTESTEWHSEEAESQGDGQPGTVSDGPSSSSAQAVKIKAQDQGEPHMEEADVPAPAINPVVDGTTPDMMNEVRTPTADPVASETTTDEEELIPAKEHAAVQHAAVQCGPVTCDQATQTSDNERPGKAAPGNYTPQGLPLQSVAMKADEHPIEETSGEVCGARRGGDARGAVRRAQTIGPERVPPHQGLNAAARLHLGKAKQLLGELLPSNPGASLTAFQMQGHYKFRHDLYHKAQQGEAYDIRGQHIDSPLLTDNVGRWIWSLVGALLTHDKLGQVQSWQTGGDLVESWMHSLWTTQGQAELDILAGVSRLASHLHDGLQNLPRALYLQLQWKTHWPEFFQALMPYLYRPDCIDGPLEASRLCNAMESMPAVQYMSRVPALHGLCDTWITHPMCPLQDTCIPTVRSCTQVKAASELHPICADTAWTSSDSQARTLEWRPLGHEHHTRPSVPCRTLSAPISLRQSIDHRRLHKEAPRPVGNRKRRHDTSTVVSPSAPSARSRDNARIRLKMANSPRSPRRHPRARVRPNGERRRTRTELARRREQRELRETREAGAGSRGSRSAGTTQRDAPAQRVPAEGTREHDTPEGWPWTLLDANSVSAPTPSAQRAQPASSSSTAVTEPQDHEQDHDKGSAQDRSRTPARRSARDPTITSRTDATPDCPTRRDDINGVLTEILREPGHRYGVQVRQDGFASAIELACSPLLQAHGISLGDIRWIVDVRDRQRYQWCDIQGSSHIRLIMSRDLPTDMGGTPHFSSPTAPTGSAEKVIDSFVAGENQGAGLGVGQPRNNTRSQNSSDQQIRYAAQKRHYPTTHMRESHHMHTLLAKSQPISTSVPPEHVNRPQAVILHARPCWGAGSANPSVEDDQWSTESRRSKEDWPRGILLGWCTAFSLLIRYRNKPKPGNKWITHRRTKGKYKRRPLHTPLRIHDVYQKFLSHRGGPKSAGPSYYNKKKTTFQGKGEVKVSPGPPTGEGPTHAINACTSAGGKMAGGAPLCRTPKLMHICFWLYLSCVICCMDFHGSRNTQAAVHELSAMTAAIPCPVKVPPSAFSAALRCQLAVSRSLCYGGHQDQRPLRSHNPSTDIVFPEGQLSSWNGAKRRMRQWGPRPQRGNGQKRRPLVMASSRLTAPRRSRGHLSNGCSVQRTPARSSTWTITRSRRRHQSPPQRRHSHPIRCARPSYMTSGHYDRQTKDGEPISSSSTGRQWKNDLEMTKRLREGMSLGPVWEPQNCLMDVPGRTPFFHSACAFLLSTCLLGVARHSFMHRAKETPLTRHSRHNRLTAPHCTIWSRALRLLCVLCLGQGAWSAPATDHIADHAHTLPGSKKCREGLGTEGNGARGHNFLMFRCEQRRECRWISIREEARGEVDTGSQGFMSCP